MVVFRVRWSMLLVSWCLRVKLHTDGLVQKRRYSIAIALELRLSCINPSIHHMARSGPYFVIFFVFLYFWSRFHQHFVIIFDCCPTEQNKKLYANCAYQFSVMGHKPYNRPRRVSLKSIILAIGCIDVICAEELCTAYKATEEFEKHFCPQTENASILKQTTWHHCVVHCLHHKKCKLISHNSYERMCILDTAPCPVFQPSDFVTSWLLKSKPDSTCISWVPYSDHVPARNVQDASNKIIVARLHRDGYIWPGKFDIHLWYTFAVLNGVAIEEAPNSNTEFLVVDPLCSTIWIAYDSSASEPLPWNSIMAGHKADKTPLYVARMWVSVPEATDFSYGYYDPDSGNGYCNFWGTRVGNIMDVLCIV